ncbi:DNA topoisomerase VI subunit B [Aeoliella mucimassa]|uniref:Type 2 DNA topoisomerase 6 subunit B n=1 Tax=Aeoliella mucimassa TaxID=2527972 RepID=A0A518AIF1_9BACT|nr:DNA topoisomerase VI subunit B [Aeoliella mucimassa]QDU54511.1 DNA topoisomerase VI subunit B [Aeoliella mucimassa]
MASASRKKKPANSTSDSTESDTAAPKRSSARRSTAKAMAANQKEISVSEFFAKNRHLLGFDNPRKALLTTVKEAVDNSLDACEEAGILPEIWVHIQQTGTNRYKVGIQDNGPGILKKQIPLIFGKLLYGSKFHRLRQSRGQQGIGISAAGMYGVQTTGKPVKIISKVSVRKPAHYYEIQIDTKKNEPKILNGKGEGVDIPPGAKGEKVIEKHGIEWVDQPHGTRVTIELEAKYVRGRGSVDEYLQQTAIANPHITLHYTDPEDYVYEYLRSAEVLPPEPKEIKPHPYGVEIGRLAQMIEESEPMTTSEFFRTKFSRLTPGVTRKLCEAAGVTMRTGIRKLNRSHADKIYEKIQTTKISPPATDCICPIGEDLILKGLHQVVPGEFYAAATRPPSVYRGNPFQIEVGLAYGGSAPTQNVTMDLLIELLEETDTRTVRQFLIHTFNGLGGEGADKIVKTAKLKTRQNPSGLKPKDREKLFEAMKNVNVAEGQQMEVMRYANRVPLQFQQSACAVTQTVIGTNWRGYGLSQSRGAMPKGPVSLMVHIASVWVPFTSESKEAIASYPEIQKEIRLGLQAVGRKLGMYLRRRQRVKQQSDRREIFMRYLKEVSGAVSAINGAEKDELYDQLLKVAKKVTSDADMQLDDRGRPIEEDPTEMDLGDNVLIVDPAEHEAAINRVEKVEEDEEMEEGYEEEAECEEEQEE